MSLATQLISGSVQVLNLVKNYLDNPRISKQVLAAASFNYPVPDPESTVVLRCESFRETGDADISSQLIVSETGGTASPGGSVSGKNWITDNIAPKPRNWELKGYIGFNYGATLTSVATTIGQQLAGPLFQDQLQKSKRLLREMRISRQALCFQTPNGEELIWVGIKNLQITDDPIVLNQIPIAMTLQEIPILQYDANGTIVGSGQPTNGYAANPVSQGLSTALQVSNFAGVLALAGV